MDNNIRGCYAEYLFGTECLKHNIIISYPLLDSSPYDCIVDTPNGLYKIQVKSSWQSEAKNRHTVSVNWNKSYSLDDVDFFAIYVKLYEGFFIFKNNGKRLCIRLNMKNDNSKYFNNFEFN